MSADHRPDHGLLAEFAEGLLDGTPEAEAVATRLAADPVWAAAYADLTVALTAVRADLSALGPAGPVPADVAVRIDAALAAAGTGGGAGEALRFPPRRRVLAFAAVAAAGAVVVGISVVAGLGAGVSAPAGSSTSVAIPPERVGQTVITSTGADYGAVPAAGTVRSSTSSGEDAAPFAAAADPGPPPPSAVSAPIPAALARLATPAALAACLEAVRHLVGTGAPPPRSADFGRFAGVPALVIVLAAGPSGHAQTLAVGPSCGDRAADLISRTGGTP